MEFLHWFLGPDNESDNSERIETSERQHVDWSHAGKSDTKYSQTCSIKTTHLERPHFTGPQEYTFNIIELAYKGHLYIRTIFCWSLWWSLYTSFTVSVKFGPFLVQY